MKNKTRLLTGLTGFTGWEKIPLASPNPPTANEGSEWRGVAKVPVGLRNCSALILLILLILSKNLCQAQSTVQFFLTQFTGATNDTTINIRAQNNPVIYNGNFFWQPANGTNITTTNGFATVNLIPGKYNVSFASIPQSWTITVTNSATPLNAAGLTTGTLIYSGINSITGNAVTSDNHGNYSITISSVVTNAIATAAQHGIPVPFAWYDAGTLTNKDGTFLALNVPDFTGNPSNTLTGTSGSTFSASYNSTIMNGLPGIGGLSPYSAWTNGVMLPGPLTNYTIFLVYRDTVQNPYGQIDLSFGQYAMTANLAFSDYNATQYGTTQAGSCAAWFPNSSPMGTIYTYPKQNSLVQIAVIRGSTNNIDPTVWDNGVRTASSGANTQVNPSGGSPVPISGSIFVGNSVANTTLTWLGYWGELLIYTNTLTELQVNQVNDYLRVKYRFNNQKLVMTGDSQAIGVFATAGSNTVNCLQRLLPDWECSQVGYTGWPSQMIWTNGYYVTKTPKWDGPNVMVLFPDFNNARTAGTAAAGFALATNYSTAFIQNAITNGYIVFLGTEWSSCQDEFVYPGYRTNYNNWVYTNYQALGCAGIVDFSADTRIGPLGAWTNTLWFVATNVDGQIAHLGSNSYPNIVAPLIASTVRQYFAATPTNINGTFSGSGANLTGIPNTAINNTAMTNGQPTVTFGNTGSATTTMNYAGTGWSFAQTMTSAGISLNATIVAVAFNGVFNGNGANITSLVAGNLSANGTFPAENGSALTSLTGANVTGLVPSAIAAGVATNVVSGIAITNATLLTPNESGGTYTGGSYAGNGINLTNVNLDYAWEQFGGKANSILLGQALDSGQPWINYFVAGAGAYAVISNGVLTTPITNSTTVNATYASLYSPTDIRYMAADISFYTNHVSNTAQSSAAFFCGFTQTNPGSFYTDCHVGITPASFSWNSISNGSILSGFGPQNWAPWFIWGTNTYHVEVFRYNNFGIVHGPDGIYYAITNPAAGLPIGSVSNIYPTIEPYQNNPSTELLPQFSGFACSGSFSNQFSPSANDLAVNLMNQQGKAPYGTFINSVAVNTTNQYGYAFAFADNGRQNYLHMTWNGSADQISDWDPTANSGAGGYDQFYLYDVLLGSASFQYGMSGDKLTLSSWMQGVGMTNNTAPFSSSANIYATGTSGVYDWTETTSNYIAIATNTVVKPPAAIAGQGLLWNSNNVLYFVTTLHTNYICGP